MNISAVYAPENSSMDFGLVDPEGVFHYFTVTGGSIDKTIRVSESGTHYISSEYREWIGTARMSDFA